MGIQMILQGVWASSAPSGDSLYVNFILGNGIAALYKLFPTVTWYPYFLVVTQGLALATMLFAAWRQRLNVLSFIIGLFATFACLMPGLWHLQFTIVSIVCATAGIILFTSILHKSPSRKTSSVTLLMHAGLLVLLAGLIRYYSVVLVAAFFAPFLSIAGFWWILKKTKSNKTLFGGIVLSWILTVIICVYGFRTLDVNHYQQHEVWAKWFELNIAKSQFIDYEFLKYSDETAELYKSIGWSENDYKIIKSWQYLDPEVFTAEKFNVAYNSLSFTRGIDNLDNTFFENYDLSFSTMATDALNFVSDAAFLPWLVFLLLFLSFFSWKQKTMLFALGVTFIAISIYLVFGLERYPFRVIVAMWIAFLWAVFYLKSIDFEEHRKYTVSYFAKTSGAFILFLTAQTYFISDINKAKDKFKIAQERQEIMYENIRTWSDALPDNAILYMVASSFRYEYQLPFNSIEYWKQIPVVISGGWNNQSFHQQNVLEEAGMAPNFHKAAINKDNVFVLLRKGPYDSRIVMKYLRKYYNEHHQKQFYLKKHNGIGRLGKFEFASLDSNTMNAEPILNYLKPKS